MPENTFIFVYQTICLINNKSYIGVHSTTNMNDGYIGCGIFTQGDARRNMLFHRAVRKYGYANFKRHILSFYDTYEEALEEERFIICNRWVNDKFNYNTAIGGRGNTTGWMCDAKKSEWKNNIKAAVKKWSDSGGKEIMSAPRPNAKKIRRFGKDNPMFGTSCPHLQRSVLQYDLNNNLISEFTSIKEASIATKATKPNIQSCCIGRYLSTGGFIFRYKQYRPEEKVRLENNLKREKKKKPIPYHLFSSEVIQKAKERKRFNNLLKPPKEKKLKPKLSNKRPVIMKCVQNGEEVEFESVLAASIHLDCWSTTISNNLKGRSAIVKGRYIFRFKNMQNCL